MRNALRTTAAYALLLATGAAAVLAATQNYLPKYDANGGLVDSAIYESAGKVGIGTASPTYPLDVHGAGIHVDDGNSSWIRLLRGGDGVVSNIGNFPVKSAAVNGYITFHTGGWNNEKMRIDNAGNVGIGTAAPAYPLDVKGGIHQQGASTGMKCTGFIGERLV